MLHLFHHIGLGVQVNIGGETAFHFATFSKSSHNSAHISSPLYLDWFF